MLAGQAKQRGGWHLCPGLTLHILGVGVPRYIVLAQHRRPHKLPFLLDLKLAPPAAAAGQHGVRSLIGLRKRTA